MRSIIAISFEVKPRAVIVAGLGKADVDVRFVWVRAFVFAPFPAPDTRRNAAIINNIFDALVASFGAKANFVSEIVRFFFVGI